MSVSHWCLLNLCLCVFHSLIIIFYSTCCSALICNNLEIFESNKHHLWHLFILTVTTGAQENMSVLALKYKAFLNMLKIWRVRFYMLWQRLSHLDVLFDTRLSHTFRDCYHTSLSLPPENTTEKWHEKSST